MGQGAGLAQAAGVADAGPAPTAPSQGSAPWPSATQQNSIAALPVNHRKRKLFIMNPFLMSACQILRTATRLSCAGNARNWLL